MDARLLSLLQLRTPFSFRGYCSRFKLGIDPDAPVAPEVAADPPLHDFTTTLATLCQVEGCTDIFLRAKKRHLKRVSCSYFSRQKIVQRRWFCKWGQLAS